jgi:ABC-type transporter Mla MlaB component
VRNPTTDWVELDRVEPSDSGEHSKQALKRMIERKAHNDGVRKREFSQLRKIRQTSPVNGVEMAQRPSSFRDSSGFSVLDERAQTLKKIDEIEAQMSKQWWKGRQGAVPPTAKDAPSPRPKPVNPALAESLLQDDSAFASTLASDLRDSLDDVPTQMGAVAESDVMSGGQVAAPPGGARGFEMSGNSAFSTSKMVSIDMGQNLSDPALEEAAIRFANSDDAGAEAVLLAALQTAGASPESTDTWACALFDMYRGTGQQASFERVALDYALRFGRSAPIWFSTPQALGLNLVPDRQVSPPRSDGGGQIFWDCPVTLDVPSVEQLQASVILGGGPCCLDWHALKTITPTAAQALAGLFARWCEQPLTLHVEGVEALDHALRAQTPVGENQVAQFWWQLRLDALRILRQQEEFELVAMDFCVTYEMSPPPWQPARCQRAYGQDAETQVMEWGAEAGQEEVSPADAVRRGGRSAEVSTARQLELSGEVLGDAADVLRPLQAAIQAGGVLTVTCAQLIRVDFSAAGSILNWVANAQASGAKIELHDVPRLVAAFFNLIGINEHARVTARIN